MKQETSLALDFLISYIQRYGSMKEETLESFRIELEKVLLQRFEGHWYPDKPIKGQAYRSLEFNQENHFCDRIVAQVCRQLDLTSDSLGFRHELTLWIDPYEVSLRLGNHVCPKDNQQLLIARFDQNGNVLFHNDLDTLFSQNRIPMINPSRASPTNSTSSDSDSSSESYTPPHRVFPYPISQPSMFRNGPLFTPPRALSPQAPVFHMTPSAPINVPLQAHPLENSINLDENSLMDGNNSQPERSDTPHSMHSTTSNESTDSGYCGYVESYPYYYKLNRLYKALALQKHTTNNNHRTTKIPHHRRIANHLYQQQQQQQDVIPSSSFSTSPPTPTPLNIDRLSPFYSQQTFIPIPATTGGSRKSKY